MATTKQMVRLASSLAVLATVACGGDAAIHRPSGDPARLVNQLVSLASPAEVKQRPEFSAANWVVVEDSRTRRPSTSTRFDNLVITTDNYAVGNANGSLRMEFLNGMLMGTWFYPNDYQKCVDELAAAGVVFSIESGNGEGVALSGGDTKIRLGKDREGRRYVAWEDRRLIDEMNKWLMRNS
jgi:hypothetical protein